MPARLTQTRRRVFDGQCSDPHTIGCGAVLKKWLILSPGSISWSQKGTRLKENQTAFLRPMARIVGVIHRACDSSAAYGQTFCGASGHVTGHAIRGGRIAILRKGSAQISGHCAALAKAIVAHKPSLLAVAYPAVERLFADLDKRVKYEGLSCGRNR